MPYAVVLTMLLHLPYIAIHTTWVKSVFNLEFIVVVCIEPNFSILETNTLILLIPVSSNLQPD
jgi:hypothetical protein